MDIWFLAAIALVFFMQAGFTMVEAGFTRAKNAGNIIMKNLMDFCVGTLAFIIIGAGILCGTSSMLGGFAGLPDWSWFTDFSNYNWSSFAFNLVFCATAATIVSGAMAERTKFSSYILYSFIISLVVYPIEAFWVWGVDAEGAAIGWLGRLGYIDFAGSSAIHMVGGISALIGAAFLGPRIGKYVKDSSGKIIKINAIPGHNITLGALGCFILWFGWYGFNGAAASDAASLAKIFGTTTIAAAFAACSTMFFTWIKNGKPDVSMTLNGALAGLVGITAGCNSVDALGALIIGTISGILVVLAVEFVDIRLHVDDPVGAVAVHCVNGFFGTLAVGFFAIDGGLFYGGGFKLLGIQLLGVFSIALWTAVLMTIVFFVIKKTVGLRACANDEIAGLDSTEHGLPTAYAGFASSDEGEPFEGTAYSSISTPAGEKGTVYGAGESENTSVSAGSFSKMSKVEIICRERMFEALKTAMMGIGITGMTVTHVMGCGVQKGKVEYYRGIEVEPSLLPKIQVEIVVCKVPVELVVETAKKVLFTGHIGDGKIFVYDVENVIKVRTGEEGCDALQDVE